MSEETEDYDVSEDCDALCPECMSRRVATLDLLTQEYECLNCGHTWFNTSVNEDDRQWEIEIDADSEREAAEKALEIQRDAQSSALSFVVSNENDIEIVDLLEDEEPPEPDMSADGPDERAEREDEYRRMK